jgi:hypothetical protein
VAPSSSTTLTRDTPSLASTTTDILVCLLFDVAFVDRLIVMMMMMMMMMMVVVTDSTSDF